MPAVHGGSLYAHGTKRVKQNHFPLLTPKLKIKLVKLSSKEKDTLTFQAVFLTSTLESMGVCMTLPAPIRIYSIVLRQNISFLTVICWLTVLVTGHVPYVCIPWLPTEVWSLVPTKVLSWKWALQLFLSWSTGQLYEWALQLLFSWSTV